MNIIRSKLGPTSPIVVLTFKFKVLRTYLFVFNTNTWVINGLYKDTYQMLKNFVFEVCTI